MTKRVLVAGVACLLSLTLVAVAPTAAQIIDHTVDVRSEGAPEAGRVVFSTRAPEGETPGHAVVAAATGQPGDGELRGAWGLWTEQGKKTTGSLDVERLHSLLDQSMARLTVVVNAEQLAAATQLIEEWSSQEGSSPDSDLENLIYRLAPALGIDAPYRPGFGAGDPFALVRDLARINR